MRQIMVDNVIAANAAGGLSGRPENTLNNPLPKHVVPCQAGSQQSALPEVT